MISHKQKICYNKHLVFCILPKSRLLTQIYVNSSMDKYLHIYLHFMSLLQHDKAQVV